MIKMTQFAVSALMRRGLLAGSALLLAATLAQAGECPKDKVMVDATKPGATMAKGVSDTVLGSIDLAGEMVKADGYKFRLRRLVVDAGGIVPWHEHKERPALIYIVSGQITEYRSSCAVPIVHKAGDLAVESGDLAHWWKNTSKKPAVLISSDILHDGGDAKTM
jgi:quercetin dioxygenase-like cupin family protein